MASSAAPCTGSRPRNVDKNLSGGANALQPIYANGYDMALRFNTDGLGNTYIGIVVAWTCLLLPAAIFLIRHRNLPYLRMRNIPLAVSAVATLHVYWVLCMIAYVLNGYFPCATEYWIMSIYLPLGIALFHATNTQLLFIATAQKRYAKGDVLTESRSSRKPKARGWRLWWERLKTFTATKNTMSWIGMGMIVQVSDSVSDQTYASELTIQALLHLDCFPRIPEIPPWLWNHRDSDLKDRLSKGMGMVSYWHML